jgi:predicted esterase
MNFKGNNFFMIKKFIQFFLLLFYTCTNICAQEGRTLKFTSAFAMFPDTARAKGHFYNGKTYDAGTYYSDSTILVYIPQKFKPQATLQLVFWFHGWGNNIDTACKQFQLLEQFEASGRNAVFVFPEGPKNAPDSYGGKLEQPAIFRQLVKEVLEQLVQNKIIKKNSPGVSGNLSITLAGHSGAYRVISKIINKTPVDEVILFDAMYGQNEAYFEWLSNPGSRFVNIYTKEGGTFENSQMMMNRIADSLKLPVLSILEEQLTPSVLQANNKIFIYSNKGHNEVITNNHNWTLFLKNTPAPKAY